MRLLTGVFLTLAINAAAKHNPTEAITLGIKTPGIRIPFANLKAEAEIPAPGKPRWVFAADSVVVANAKGGLDKIDGKTGKPGDPILEVPMACAGMASGFGSFWVPSCEDGSLMRVDIRTLKRSAKLTTGVAGVTHAVTVSGDSVWLLTDGKTTVSRIDPDQNQVVGEVRVPANCRDLTFGESALWLVCPAENRVFRIDPATNLVVNQIEVSAEPQALAVGEGSVWVLCRKAGKVERIDPKTNKVTKTVDLAVPGAAGEIAVGEGSVWVTQKGFPLTRISPVNQKEAVLQQFYGAGGGAVQTGAGAVWLVNTDEGTLWKIDPKRVAATLAE